MLTLADEYRQVAEFSRKGYTSIYDTVKIFLTLNTGLVIIFGYAGTSTGSAPADVVSPFGRHAAPLFGVVIGLAASLAHWRMARYVISFLRRGEEIENAVNAGRANKDHLVFFTNILKYRHVPWTYNVVLVAYLVSSAAWLYVFLLEQNLVPLIF
jgi:hypothetical protein